MENKFQNSKQILCVGAKDSIEHPIYLATMEDKVIVCPYCREKFYPNGKRMYITNALYEEIKQKLE